MRKVDVFGKKQNLTRPFYLVILIFAMVLPGYFIIQNYFMTKNNQLLEDRLVLQASISDLFQQSQADTLLTIDEIIPYLPTRFSQNAVNSELNTVKDFSGLTLATNYQVEFVVTNQFPFEASMPSTLKAMRINISMTVDDATKILDYLDALMELDTFYYLESYQVNYLSNPNAKVDIIIYTFYNEVVID